MLMNQVHTIQLNPSQDIKTEIQNYCEKNHISAGCILSAVGSLSKLRLRLAGSQKHLESDAKYEIVSITGTISKNGSHLHISVADDSAHVFGGHLVNGNLIFTTCEIVLLSLSNQEFKRELDPATGFNELSIYLMKS